MSGIQQVGQIIQGHFNKALDRAGVLPADLKQLADLRFQQCTTCHVDPVRPLRDAKPGPGLAADGKTCNHCACDMTAKTKVLSAACPAGRW